MFRKPTRFSRTSRRLNESKGIVYEFRMLENKEINPIAYFEYPRVEKFDKNFGMAKIFPRNLIL